MRYRWLQVLAYRPPGRWVRWGIVLGLLAAATLAITTEVRNSTLQAALLAKLARDLNYQVEPGPSDAIRFPGPGPHDLRLGYSQLPRFLEQLTTQGFTVTAQARMSPGLLRLSRYGLFDIYQEKDQAGLEVLDCRRDPLMQARFPQRAYDRFEAAPRVVVDALLFIENRELLDERHPSRNPAVEWDRFGKAAVEWARRIVDPDRNVPGGSTLATQIEKYRHSPEGRTDSIGSKLRQMASASLRAYHVGDNTLGWRRQIVLQYLNTVPLAARPGFGEVNGLGDGLWAWYGREFDDVNQLLRTLDDDLALRPSVDADADTQRQTLAFRQALLPLQAVAFKQALSLFVAQRRPSYYLGGDGATALSDLTDSHVRLMAEAGVISPVLRDAALRVRLKLLERVPTPPRRSFIERKATMVVRNRLSDLLDVQRTYDLDRLDVVTHTSLDGRAQQAVTQLLHSLKDPATARAAGLYGYRLLGPGDDPSRLSVSLTLYERGPQSNVLRVQADNQDQPFDLNDGARLDLGSTAKLRTLVSYLEIIAALHGRWHGLTPSELASHNVPGRDVLGRWALEHLQRTEDRSLAVMLDAALKRYYSTSKAEAFFTGGGLHRFSNFDETNLPAQVTVEEALQHSVNLPFVRIMRDIVRYHVFEAGDLPAPAAGGRRAALDPQRRELLERFAEREGREFITRYFRKYQTTAFLPDEKAARRLPVLERWVVEWLRQQPDATLEQTVQASREERQKTYSWLFTTPNRRAQDLRISNQRELEAFVEIQRSWRRLGYPFEALTPSYATALGASGDRPSALAELMGILANDGIRRPVTRITGLEFGQRTPYETRLAYQAPAGERVLPAEVAVAARRAAQRVVEAGTARRLHEAWKLADGTTLPIAGKTGTGDHRFEVHGRGGRVMSSRVVSRTGTFAFVVGTRYYGTVMVYVPEPYAASFRFTSALPSQLLKALVPTLVPLLEHGTCGGEGGSAEAPDMLSVGTQPEGQTGPARRAVVPARSL